MPDFTLAVLCAAVQLLDVRRMSNTTPDFERLFAFIEKLPAINLPAARKSIGHGVFKNGNWWIKFALDTKHALAWRHVQELGFVLNYVTVGERLPTVLCQFHRRHI